MTIEQDFNSRVRRLGHELGKKGLQATIEMPSDASKPIDRIDVARGDVHMPLSLKLSGGHPMHNLANLGRGLIGLTPAWSLAVLVCRNDGYEPHEYEFEKPADVKAVAAAIFTEFEQRTYNPSAANPN